MMEIKVSAITRHSVCQERRREVVQFHAVYKGKRSGMTEFLD
jgi:hypothetical protein